MKFGWAYSGLISPYGMASAGGRAYIGSRAVPPSGFRAGAKFLVRIRAHTLLGPLKWKLLALGCTKEGKIRHRAAFIGC